MPTGERSTAIWLPGGAQVGFRVSEVLAAFVASLAGMWRNHDDGALRFDGRWLHLEGGCRQPIGERVVPSLRVGGRSHRCMSYVYLCRPASKVNRKPSPSRVT